MLDIRGSQKVTGSFLLSDRMKASTGLKKVCSLAGLVPRSGTGSCLATFMGRSVELHPD